jgi:hypothetical protein
MKYDACPLCDHPRFVVDERAERWRLCQGCGHSFTAEYFLPEELAHMPVLDSQRVGYALEDMRLPASRLVERVLPFADSGDWLDVGYGDGSLLLTAQEYGFRVHGVEARDEGCEVLAAFGITVNITGELWHVPGAYDVVSLCDVLEHIPFPKAALLSARRLGKVLLVTCPNLSAPVSAWLEAQQAWPYWDEQEHFHNFTRERLYLLLKECGFTPRRYGISERYRCGMEVVAT